MASHGWNHRFNADGFVRDSPASAGRSYGYAQLFRSGVVENATTQTFRELEGRTFVVSQYFEQEVIAAVERSAALAQRLGLPAAQTVLVSLVGANDALMGTDRSRHWFGEGYPIGRDPLEVPPVRMDDPGSAAAALKPAFDFIWQASGWPGSQCYNPDGSRRQ